MAVLIVATRVLADAIPNPKRIWHDIDRYVVFTNGDIVLIDPPPSQDDADGVAARSYGNLTTLRNLTAAQVQTAADAVIPTLHVLLGLIKTLQVAVSILARRI